MGDGSTYPRGKSWFFLGSRRIVISRVGMGSSVVGSDWWGSKFEEVFLSIIILFNKGNYIHVNHYGVYENNCIRNQSVNMQMAHHAND